MSKKTLPGITRRQILRYSAATAVLGAAKAVNAITIKGTPSWSPFDNSPPPQIDTDGWVFFTDQEAAAVEAIADRLIPADELSVGGKDAGCAVFIDRQLAGFYGTFDRLYMQGPFKEGTPEQGDQSPLVPQQRYRIGLAALEGYCQSNHKKSFKDLTGDQQDQILTGLQQGKITLNNIDAKLFFSIVHQNTMEGFFADPIYGGNRNMVSWKMLGFPGARYDYREFIGKHNQKLNLEPLSIMGSDAWKMKS
jgi:gluconate 2-dehydrogenase gamma chain